MHALCEEDFLKQVTILSEREKKISMDITGDFFTVKEMQDDGVPENLSRYLEQATICIGPVFGFSACTVQSHRPSSGTESRR